MLVDLPNALILIQLFICAHIPVRAQNSHGNDARTIVSHIVRLAHIALAEATAGGEEMEMCQLFTSSQMDPPFFNSYIFI